MSTGRNRKSTTTRSTTARPAASVAAATPATVKTDDGSWVHDYDYVMKDLRKLTIVSLSLFAIIIILGFFF